MIGNKETVLVSKSISSPTQDIFILPDLYVDEKIREEEAKHAPTKEEIKQNLDDEEEDKSEGESQEEEKIDIMAAPKIVETSEQIVILSKSEISIFDLTSNSLNSHSIAIDDSEINSEVI